MFAVLIFWFICGIASMFVATSRGGEGCLWMFIGIVLGPLGLIMAFSAGKSTTERAQEQATLNAKAITKANFAQELERLVALKDKGALTDAEFDAAKAKLLR